LHTACKSDSNVIHFSDIFTRRHSDGNVGCNAEITAVGLGWTLPTHARRQLMWLNLKPITHITFTDPLIVLLLWILLCFQILFNQPIFLVLLQIWPTLPRNEPKQSNQSRLSAWTHGRWLFCCRTNEQTNTVSATKMTTSNINATIDHSLQPKTHVNCKII